MCTASDCACALCSTARVHRSYEKAASEQQKQIKALLREANARAKAQQESAVSLAVAEAKMAVEAEKQQALEAARGAVAEGASAASEQVHSP